ncbi:MAG: hypothetical protein BGO66_17590 [Alicycliphilus sp. 69-12]|nr:MAG: hypothetical protein BGO66_17590 [Alicycliphilus sp. 69-12]
MANAVEKSAQNAGKAVEGIGHGAQPAAGKIDNATKSIIQSIERATAAMKAGEKGSAGYFEELAKQRGISGDALKPYIASLREAEAAQKAALLGQQGMAMSAKQTAAALRGVPAQITDIVVSLQGGQAPLTVLLQQGGQLRDMFGGAGAAARALGGAVLGMVNPLTVSLATVAGLGYAYSQGSKEADAFRLALVSTGSASGATVGQLQQMAASIDGVVGTQAKAAETLALFATQTVAGKASMEQYATAAIAWEQASGESVESVAKKFGSLKDAPLQGVLKLNESMNFLTESVYTQIKSLEEQGKTTEAAKVAQDALANALQDRSAEMVKNLGSIERGWKNVKHAVAETWDAIKGIGRVTPPEELLSASRSRVNVMQAEYDYKSQRGMSTGTLGERLEKEKGLLATLQAQVTANADNAKAEADRLTQTTARADADKNALKYLDDQAKMARQIAAERETIQRAYTGKTDAASQKAMAAEIEASEANIRKSYEKTKKVRESAATGENEVASIRAKIAEQTRYLQTMQETGAEYTKLTEGERLVIKINEELQTGLKGAARASKEKALAAAEALVVVEKQVGAEQALAKSNAESEAAYRKDLSAMAQRTDAMDAQAAQLEAANAVYGKGKIAIEEYNLQLEQERLKRLNALGLQGATTEELTREIEARKRLLAAMKQAEFKAASKKSTESLEQAKAANDLVREEIGLIGMTEVERKKIIAARKADIELAKELRAIDAMGIDESDKETLRIEARAKSRIDAETNAARAVLDGWQKTADEINRSLTDALLRGFESGKGFAENFRDTLKNMFNTLVLRPIISAVMQPVSMAVNGAVQGGVGVGGGSNVLGTASNVASLFGAGGIGGSLMAGAGWLTGATTFGGALGAGASLIGTGTMAGAMSGIGMIAGALGPIALGVAALTSLIGGLDDSGTPHAGAGAVYSGGSVTGGRDVYSYDRFDLADMNTYSDQVQGLVSPVAQSIGAALDAFATAFGQQAGYTVSTAFADDSSKDASWGALRIEDALGQVLVDWNSDRQSKWAPREFSDGEQGQKEYLAAIARDTRQVLLDMDLPSWADEILESIGDTADMDALTAAMTQIGKVQTSFEQLGASMQMFAGITDELQAALMGAAGGIDALVNSAGAFYQGFYTEAERMDALRGQLNTALSGLDLTIDPNMGDDAKAQFRQAVEDAMAAGDAELAASLLAISGNFATAADYFEQLSRDAAEAAKKSAEDARKALIDSTYDMFRRLVDRDRDLLSSQASAISEVIGQISTSVDMLKSNARDLYGTVDSTAQMLAAQGMVYIEDALAGVRGGASITGYTGLQDAVTAARGGINSGVYVSQFERDRDALVLAGQLAEMAELGDVQLSVQERQLRAVNEQLEYLDTLSKRADDLVNGTAALTGTVDERFQQLLGLLGLLDEGAAGTSGGGSSGGAVFGGTSPGGTGFVQPDPSKYSQVRSDGSGGTWYDPIRDESVIAHLDKLAPVYHSFDGTGDLAGLAEAIKAAGGTVDDLSMLSGYYASD